MVIGVIKDHKSRQSASMILMPLYLEGKWEKFHMKVSKNLEQNTTLDITTNWKQTFAKFEVSQSRRRPLLGPSPG